MKTREVLIVAIICTSFLICGVAYKKFILDPQQGPVAQQLVPPTTPEVPPEKPEPEPPASLEDAVASITADELKEIVYYLADDKLEGRQSGEPGCDAARDYIKKFFEDLGLQVELDEFRVSRGDGTAENVYAWIDGSENPDEIVVIGGHYDHIGKSRSGICNGADDNASGTAAVMEMAEALVKLKGQNKRTIVFQLYAGEELGLVGSSHYANEPTFPRSSPSMRNHIFMENLDMIGRSNMAGQILQYEREASPISDIIRKLESKYPFAGKYTREGMSGGASDHAPFTRKGVPAVFVHTGTHRDYHRPSDDADKINYNGMEQITKYGLELAWEICQNGLARQANFVEKDIEMLDHGVQPFLQ